MIHKLPYLLRTLVGFVCLCLLLQSVMGKEVVREWVSYVEGGDKVQKLSVFKPKDADGLLPAIVMYHGGSWRIGSSSQLSDLATHLARRDVILISVGYRRIDRETDDVRDCLVDAIKSYHWVCQNAESIGVDPEQIAIGGASAGGHLALCVSLLDPFGYYAVTGGERKEPVAYIGLNPVVSTNDHNFSETTFLAYGDALNPIEMLKNNDIQLNAFIAHGSADSVVPLQSVEDFIVVAEASGGAVQLEVFQGKPHGFFNPKAGREQTLKVLYSQIDLFLDQVFGIRR